MNLKIGVSIKLLTASIVLSQSINLLSIQKVNAADFKFTKIADKNTPIPGGIGNFQSFGSPSLSGHNIAFQGYNFDNYDRIKNQGIYISTGLSGGLTKIADKDTLIPGGIGNFRTFGSQSISGNNIVFEGYGYYHYGNVDQQGIYVTTPINSALTNFVDKNTLIPDFTSKKYVRNPSISGSNIAFTIGEADETGYAEKRGIYANTGENGALIKIAGTNTPIPDSISNFDLVDSASISGSNIAFWGGALSSDIVDHQGIYASTGENRALIKIADTNTPIPGSVGNFTYVESPRISGRNIVFSGVSDADQQGIYANMGENGALLKIADTNTPIPDSNSNFHYFEGISISGSNIAFAGILEDNYYEAYREMGVYLYADGVLSKVISSTDTLIPGKTIRNIYMSNQGLDGESLAFLAAFNDNSIAIFRADRIYEPVPEPLTLGGTAVAGFVGFWLKKKKKKVVV
ncbi:PEP-CTERM sorting domain-containing protein [Chlorogloeopsis sp. ULAP01]|uniref:DUF7453 family protein n=1 Tax=Chlorogloeopsis sp. ULAP01 TaxID=3056483 RepID=UPI0025AA5167|nr:PEP-CTERM sorting domain-containing protein [Chlorogloeopsis sp. ULAP01]MDM9384259.1 PEP-CTERM sorting domain-containing protein [Chlorogloeopsis sp. ULAP01]